MLSWITAIPSLISGAFGTINNITAAISNEKINARNAQTAEEKIASEERVKTLEARRDLMIAEAGVSKANILVRTAFAGAVILVIWKLIVWDKVIGSFVGCSQAPAGTCKIFTTDPFDDNQWHIIMVVIGFYFLYEGAVSVTRTIKR
jgi:hypothetical protein